MPVGAHATGDALHAFLANEVTDRYVRRRLDLADGDTFAAARDLAVEMRTGLGG